MSSDARSSTGALCALACALLFGACSGGGKPATCGGGAQACGSNADCGGFQCVNGCCGTTPVCQGDGDCPAGEHCTGGTCTSGDGGGASCGSNADCANNPGATKCDLAGSKTCVECVKASDCGTPAKTCEANKCVQVPSGCASDADCAGDPAGPRCKLTSHVCVPCLGNQDCGLGQVCTNFACVAANGACTDNTACAAPTPVCDSAAGQCVECTGDTQCAAGQKCENRACVAGGCSSDDQCGQTAPRCDTGTGACVECLATADCGDPTLACENEHCVAAQTGCQSDGDCSGQTPHCDVGTHSCVVCTASSQCTNGDLCQAGACVPPPPGCTTDGDCASHPSAPKCDASTGSCVGCLASSDCQGGVCDPSAHACVGCLANSDCGSGKICRNAACVAGCATDADCAQSLAGHRCLASTNSCVACLADADCPSGDSCTNNACAPATGSSDSPCAADGSCAAGQYCISSADGQTQTCRASCDPYNPGTACAADKTCAWVGFDSAGKAAGACLPKNGEGAAGAGCQSDADCENDLLCLPVSATQAKCAALCDPDNGSCGSGESCHPLAAYYDDQTQALDMVGACLDSASTYGQGCYSDYTSTGADCGAGMTCGPNPLLADGSIRVSSCQYPYGTGGAATSCTDGAGCKTGDCLQGPLVCDTSCHWTSDCSRAGLSSSYKCLPYPWFGQSSYTGQVNESNTGACLPTCTSDATCGQGRFCMESPTFENSGKYESSFWAFCYRQLGDSSGPEKKAGAQCSADSECESGYCVLGKTGGTDGYCFGACDKSDPTQCDPAHGTTCDPKGVGLLLNDGLDGVAGSQDDQYGRAYVCGGVGCTRDADCAGFNVAGSGPRTCRLTLEVDAANGHSNTAFGATQTSRATCEPRVGNSNAGATCSSNNACKSGWCYAWGSASSSKRCMGACQTDADCGSGSTCQPFDFSAAHDGSNVIDICAP